MTHIQLIALEGKSFDVTTYRGYAKLSDLARISQADVYDESKNPGGIQRDLDENHARKAYRYAAFGEGKLGNFRLWPEIVLNVRDPTIVTKESIKTADGVSLTMLDFDLSKIGIEPGIRVSRVDGNHRLRYAMGDEKRKFPPVEEITPFSLTIGLDVLEEQTLFKDINDNQKGMNTSHLDSIVYRALPKMKLVEDKPELWISVRLHEDAESPFLGLVYRGGVRSQGSQRFINLRSFKNGVYLLLQAGKTLKNLPGSADIRVQAQYALIRNYWTAVKKIYSADWNKDTLLLKGVGYRAMSIVGGVIIDRCLALGKTESKDMEHLLERTKKTRLGEHFLDWSTNGPVSSYGGMKAVNQLADEILTSIPPVDEGTVRSIPGEPSLLEKK